MSSLINCITDHTARVLIHSGYLQFFLLTRLGPKVVLLIVANYWNIST